MTQEHNFEQDDRYLNDIQNIATDIQAIARIVEPTADGLVETPTLYPMELTDDQGETMEVTTVKIDAVGSIDGNEKVTRVQLSDTPHGTAHKTIFGLLVERPTSGKSPKYEFRSTPIIESAAPVTEMPTLREFKPVSPQLAANYDDGVLYDVAFELRALVEPQDVPYPEEQHPDAVEALAESGATIPGVAYMGRLLVEHH